MKLALLALLSLVSFPVMAAVPHFNIELILHWVFVLLVIGIIFGLVLFLVRKAPFIPPEFKTVIEYICWALLIVAVIYVLLSLI